MSSKQTPPQLNAAQYVSHAGRIAIAIMPILFVVFYVVILARSGNERMATARGYLGLWLFYTAMQKADCRPDLHSNIGQKLGRGISVRHDDPVWAFDTLLPSVGIAGVEYSSFNRIEVVVRPPDSRRPTVFDARAFRQEISAFDFWSPLLDTIRWRDYYRMEALVRPYIDSAQAMKIDSISPMEMRKIDSLVVYDYAEERLCGFDSSTGPRRQWNDAYEEMLRNARVLIEHVKLDSRDRGLMKSVNRQICRLFRRVSLWRYYEVSEARGECAERLVALAEEAGLNVSNDCPPDVCFSALQRLYLNQGVPTPFVGLTLQPIAAVCILEVVVVFLAVGLHSALCVIDRIYDGSEGEPWLILDGRSPAAAATAWLWMLLVAFAPVLCAISTLLTALYVDEGFYQVVWVRVLFSTFTLAAIVPLSILGMKIVRVAWNLRRRRLAVMNVALRSNGQ